MSVEDNCVFCKIIKGDIPSYTIYEDSEFKAFLDISPASKGHTILIPKLHVENLYELPDNLAEKIIIVAKKIAKGLKKELDYDGLNLLQNNGEVAGQSVFHFHMHLIPRYKDDKVVIKFVEEKDESLSLEELSKKIRKYVED